MIAARVSRVLRDKLLQVTEGVAFMLIEDDSAALPTAMAPGIEVKLSFTGPKKGALWLAMSEEDSRRLAVGMLGRPLEEPIDSIKAAPAEFLNILANWVLDALWGDGVSYQVGVPVVNSIPLERSEAFAVADDQRACVRTDVGCTFVCGVTWADEGVSN